MTAEQIEEILITKIIVGNPAGIKYFVEAMHKAIQNDSEYQVTLIANLTMENHELKRDNESNQKLLDECAEWLQLLNKKPERQNVTNLINRIK